MSEITLTLSGTGPPSSLGATEELPSAERARIERLAQQINLHDSLATIRYGESAQSQLKHIADDALTAAARRDVSKVGDLLLEISSLVKDFAGDITQGGVLELLRPSKRAKNLQAKYAQTAKTIDRIKKELEGQRLSLTVDIKVLDDLYQQLLNSCVELSAYVAAGQQKLAAANGELEQLHARASTTGSEQDAIRYDSFHQQCVSFAARLQDLELTKTISLQTVAQIQLALQVDTRLVQKIQSSINNAIPVWQQSIATALTLKANEAELGLKNTELLMAIDDALTAQTACKKEVALSQI